jgi:hypothetical protein
MVMYITILTNDFGLILDVRFIEMILLKNSEYYCDCWNV